jgi:hypothetical protein
MDLPNPLMEFTKSFHEIGEMILILGQDCKEHFEASNINGSLTSRRAYIRSVFALIEGVQHQTRIATSNLGILLSKVSLNELVVLDGNQLDVNDKGEVTPRPYYPVFLNNFKFTFRIFSKSLGSQFSLNLSGEGWQSLCRAVKVRDRLMHPKVILDLQVSDAEISDAKKAFDWFLYNHNLSGYYAQKALQDKTSTSEEAIAALDANIRRMESELAARGN